MNELDGKTIRNVAIMGAGLFAATFLAAWGGGMEWLTACKTAAGVVGGWLLGHLQRTGSVVPSVAGLKRDGAGGTLAALALAALVGSCA